MLLHLHLSLVFEQGGEVAKSHDSILPECLVSFIERVSLILSACFSLVFFQYVWISPWVAETNNIQFFFNRVI